MTELIWMLIGAGLIGGGFYAGWWFRGKVGA
jgi:hypothetical protein